MNIPVIKLEVESMKYTVVTALQQHAALMDSSIQAAVESYCTPENIDAVVQEAAKQALDAAVKQEVRDYFWRWNANGRMAVREAAFAFLDEQYPVKREGE